MPIRMVEDPNDRDSGTGGGGRGGRGGGNLIGILLGLVFRYPKLLIPILIIGGIMVWKGGCIGGIPGTDNSTNSAFATGGTLDPEQYAKADIFNFLYEDNKTNPLPESVSLLDYCPQRMNQGAQGSCVAWSNAYSARTILYARQTGQNPDQVAFSPSYLFNNIKLNENCQGSYIVNAVKWMSETGAVPLRDFTYDPNSCSRDIPDGLNDKAANFKIKGAQRLGENPNAGLKLQDILQIKQSLKAGSPVVIGMMVGGSFMQDMMGKKVWHPNSDDRDQNGFGGHAMTVIGYDDNLEGGALQLMNSWGPEWGENGIAWVRYADFVDFVKEAYAYAPMGKYDEVKPEKFEVVFSLMNNNTKSDIPLTEANGRFVTKNKVAPGTPFKIKIKNNVECYSYIFGQDTNASSYVLYPYTAKHSPYCGVSGTRVFPRYFNMQPDNIGTSDFIAIYITRKPVNFEEINQKINRNINRDYGFAVHSALRGELATDVKFTVNDAIQFRTPYNEEKGVVAIIEIRK
ncbi:MAG: peptidase C1 [Bacteroidetes bacterium]|nr:peptidase C1 [Bacteroidota bacterium]